MARGLSFSLRWTVAGFWLLSGIGLSGAGAEIRGAGVRFDLIAETPSVRAGEPFQVGLWIRHEPGWHTYWRQPGIVGVPTTLDWDLPDGFTAGPIQWPPPERVKMSVLTAWGYERDTLLMVEIVPPTVLDPAKDVVLRSKAGWMACARSCHPGWGELEIRLPVSASGGTEPDLDPDYRPLFEQTRESLPRPLAGWTATVVTGADGVHRLRLLPDHPGAAFRPDPAAEWYFFSHSAHVHSDEPQGVTFPADGAVELSLRPLPIPAPPEKVLEGVIFCSSGLPDGSGSGSRFALVRAKWLPTPGEAP